MPRHSLSRLLSDLRWCLSAAIILSAILTITTFLSSDSFIHDFVSNFPVQYAVLGVFGVGIFGARRQWMLAIVSLGVIGGNIRAITPYLNSPTVTVSPANAIRVMVANVHTSNTNYEDVLRLVKSINPTLVVFLEVNNSWEKHLNQLDELLPFSTIVPREDNFGIAIFSVSPLSELKAEPFAPGQPPSIRAVLKIGERTISVFAVHPVPPIGSNGFELRNQQLTSLAGLIQQSAAEALVIGDLNTTVWSPWFQTLIDQSKLTNPRLKFGIIPTWPRQIPLLFVPIDHILTSNNLQVLNLEAFPTPGSDHRALIADVLLQATSK